MNQKDFEQLDRDVQQLCVQYAAVCGILKAAAEALGSHGGFHAAVRREIENRKALLLGSTISDEHASLMLNTMRDLLPEHMKGFTTAERP